MILVKSNKAPWNDLCNVSWKSESNIGEIFIKIVNSCYADKYSSNEEDVDCDKWERSKRVSSKKNLMLLLSRKSLVCIG